MQQRKACLHWSYAGVDGPGAVWTGAPFAGPPPGGMIVHGVVGVEGPAGMPLPFPFPDQQDLLDMMMMEGPPGPPAFL
jgi:hypothetical protein